MNEIMYEPSEELQRWPGELGYRVVEVADLQARLANALDPARPASDDLVKTEKDGISWAGIIRHTDVVIWIRKLPADVLRETASADEGAWAWTPPAGEEAEFASMPLSGLATLQGSEVRMRRIP